MAYFCIREFVVFPYEDFVRLYPKIEQEEGNPHEVVRNMIYKDISRIRAWREYLGLTQKEAALSQIEAVNAKPRKNTLEKLSAALGTTAEQLH